MVGFGSYEMGPIQSVSFSLSFRFRFSLSFRFRFSELRFILDDSIAEGSQTLELIRSLDVKAEALDTEMDEEDGETQSKA